MVLSSVSLGLIDVLAECIPGLISCVKLAFDIQESANKQKKKELQNAVKSLGCGEEIYVSNKLHEDILRMSKGSLIMEIAFTSLGVKSGKLILYTLYYLTDPNAKKLPFDLEDCAFINAIAQAAGVRRIYENADVAELARYDSKFAGSDYAEPYILSIDDLFEKVKDEAFQQKLRTKMGMMMISDSSVPWLTGTIDGLNGRVDGEGMIHPIFFSDDPYTQDYSRIQSNDISQSTYELFERELSPFFGIYDHYFYSTNEDGAYTLNIIREESMGAVDTYILDDGSMLGGNNVSILGSFIDQNYNPNTLFVSVRNNPEIVKKMLMNKFYMLDNFEVMAAVRSYFNNTIIYRNIDFSNTPFFDSLTWDQKNILERKLGNALNYIEDCRLRFYTFSSVDSFTLISDDLVKSPLMSSGATSSKIIEGMTVIVSGDFADIYVNGKKTRVSLV